MAQNAQRLLPQRRAPILLDDYDDDDEPEFLGEIGNDVQTNSRLPPRCVPVHPVSCKAGTLRPNVRVELKDGDFLHIKEIYRDYRVSAGGTLFLKGNLMRRTLRANGMLEKKINELFYVLTTTSSNQNPTLDECLVTWALEDVKRVREIIVTNQDFPAFSWREQMENYSLSHEERAKHLRLVCRWKFADETNTSGTNIIGGFLRKVNEQECDKGKLVSRLQQLRDFLGEDRVRKAIQSHDERIQADEEDFAGILNASPNQLKNKKKRSHDRMTIDDTIDVTNEVIDLTSDSQFRSTRTEVNKTIRRLSSEVEITTKKKSKTSTIIHTGSSHVKQSIKDSFATSRVISERPQKRARFSHHALARPAQQRSQYIYADICAGAGGMASGAAQVGLKIQYLLDNWSDACETLSANFPGARVLLEEVFDFCNNEQHWPWEQVDILHISYPCQPHSRLNRHDRDGGRNPENIATSFATQKLLSRCKPRIVTFEQTAHIITKNNGEFFRKIIHDLASEGYEARWRICDLAEYGTVQRRRRLIIIASCPGETLPTFPEPTHGLRIGLKKPTTIRQVLRALKPYKASMPDIMRSSRPRDASAYNADTPLRGLISCDGGVGNLHPNGQRTFELCELAALQSFLATHQFSGGKTAILKQIGNAVPSCFAKTLFEHIAASLRESDRLLAAYKPEVVDLID